MVAAGDLHKISTRPLLFSSRCRREGLLCPLTQKCWKTLSIILTVFCNSHHSILTLHSIQSTSNPSLYCGDEHWPCTLFIILSVTSWLMIVFRLSITKEWRESKIWTTHMNSLRRPLSPRKTSLLASMCSSLVSWFEIYLVRSPHHFLKYFHWGKAGIQLTWLIFSCGQHYSQPYRCVCYPTEVCFDMLNFYICWKFSCAILLV